MAKFVVPLLHQTNANAMKNFTEAQVVSHLVKNGWNEQEAIKVVAANYDYVRNTYPEARCAKVAEIVAILN